MGKKKMVMRRLAALLAASMVLTSSAFTSLAAGESSSGSETVNYTLKAVGEQTKTTEVDGTVELEVAAVEAATGANASVADASRLEAVNWTTEDADIVDLKANGLKCSVTAKTAGTATVKATPKESGLEACAVTFTVKVKAASVTPTPTIPPIDPGLVDSEDHTENDKAVVDAIVNVEEKLPEGIQISEVDTKGVEGNLTAEDAEKVAQDTVTQTTDIKKELDSFEHDEESAAQAASVVSVQTQVEAVDVTSAAAVKALADEGLTPEDLKNVKVKVDIEAPKVKTKVTKGPNGEVETKVVVVKATFNINLMATNAAGEEKKVPLAKMGNTTRFTVPLILPENIDESANWALITHIMDNGNREQSKCRIRSSNGQKFIKIVGSHFSPFEITFSEDEPKNVTDVEVLENDAWKQQSTGGYGGRSSGGSRTTTASAQWIQNATGWWYKNADGTWPANTWAQLTWNNTSSWYRFNAEGYMVAGWFTDADQNRYFLHNVSDGTQGHMYTGWHQIDGIWYYFRENVGGPMGSLVVNGVTPDGYQVDANGAWIQ